MQRQDCRRDRRPRRRPAPLPVSSSPTCQRPFMSPDCFVILALAAATLEAVFGYPSALYRAIGHPVTWMGRMLGWLDRTLNREACAAGCPQGSGCAGARRASRLQRRSCRRVAVVVAGVMGGMAAARISRREPARPAQPGRARPRCCGWTGTGLDAGPRRRRHDRRPRSRRARRAGVSRAAIESLAENFSDGVVAPVFWIGARRPARRRCSTRPSTPPTA